MCNKNNDRTLFFKISIILQAVLQLRQSVENIQKYSSESPLETIFLRIHEYSPGRPSKNKNYFKNPNYKTSGERKFKKKKLGISKNPLLLSFINSRLQRCNSLEKNLKHHDCSPRCPLKYFLTTILAMRDSQKKNTFLKSTIIALTKILLKIFKNL